MPPPLLCQVHMLHMSTRFKKASFSTCLFPGRISNAGHLARFTCPGVTCRECDAKTSFKHSHPDIIQNTPARSAQRRSCLSLNPPRRHGRDLHALSDCIFQLVGQSRHIQTWEQCLTMFPSTLLRIFDIQSFK